MGVHGLNTYIIDHADLYLQPFELKDSYLVIDGNNIAAKLYIDYTKSDSFFGGDYDEYYRAVKHFFLSLTKCQIIPIVLMDGAHEKKKVRTILQRAYERVISVNAVLNNCPKSIFPLFLTVTFINVLHALNITCIQCDYEADSEIATVANALNCPVLSSDSDFYVFDVLYIPYCSVKVDPIEVELPDKKYKYYIECCIYKMEYFFNVHNVDITLLPVLVTLLGNDFVNNSIFYNFFNHISVKKNKRNSYTQNKIHSIVNWLKNENFHSAVKGILNYLKKEHTEKVLKAIDSSAKDYKKGSLSQAVYLIVQKILSNSQDQIFNLGVKKNKKNLPLVIYDLFNQGKLLAFIMDFITLNSYFTQVQLEDMRRNSTHFISLKLIVAINQILNQYTDNKSKSKLKVHLVIKKRYQAILLQNNYLDSFQGINLNDILNVSKNDRLQLLYSLTDLDKEDIKVVSNFCDGWSLFVLAMIYWTKSLVSISYAHIYALSFMAVANQIVQKNIGYYRKVSMLTYKKKHIYEEGKSSVLESKNDSSNFKCMLNDVTKYECFLVQKILIPLRHTNNVSCRFSHIYLVHLFNCFQSCLYHIMQINALLNYPLENLKISDFYSGTLLLNSYLSISKSGHVSAFPKKVFKDAPNVGKIYFYLCEHFHNYFTEELPKETDLKKKKKKKKRNKKNPEFIVISESRDENDAYDDEDNPYSILQGCA